MSHAQEAPRKRSSSPHLYSSSPTPIASQKVHAGAKYIRPSTAHRHTSHICNQTATLCGRLRHCSLVDTWSGGERCINAMHHTSAGVLRAHWGGT